MRRFTSPRALALVALLVPLLLPLPSLAADASTPEESFEAAYAQFSRAYRQADPGMVADVYWPDAYYLSPNQEIAQGDVRSHFEWLATMEPGAGPHISFEILDREVSGDLAYDIGIYTIHRDDSDGPPGRGKFIVIWKRGDDGTWKIHADGFSAIRPPEESGENED